MDCKEEKFEIIFESHIYIIVYDLWDEKHFILMLISTAEINIVQIILIKLFP